MEFEPWSRDDGRPMPPSLAPPGPALAGRPRARSPLLALLSSLSLAVAGLVAACSLLTPSQTKVVVAHTPVGDRAFHEEGRTMPMNHWELENGASGLKKGFFVVKNEFEWRSLWPTVEADKIPILP